MKAAQRQMWMPRKQCGASFFEKNLVARKKVINFALGIPLGHLMQEWWNGRHGGLKIPWPLRAVWVRVPFPVRFCLAMSNRKAFLWRILQTAR